jgi:predicted nucleic acid-binding protein
VIVIDASAAAELVLETEVGARVAIELRGHALHAPGNFDVETVGVIRRAVLRDLIDDREGLIAVDDLQSLRIKRWPVAPLIGEAYALRATHSVADAIYVALAEMLQAPLITCDGRLSRSHGHRADVVLVD